MDCIHLRKRGGSRFICRFSLTVIKRCACIACTTRTDKATPPDYPHPSLAPRTRAMNELGKCMRIGAQLKEERWRTK